MSEEPTNPKPVEPPKLCGMHRWLLVEQAGFMPSDPWMALEVVTQVALFQACTCDDKIYEKLGGDIQKISTIGCMACAKPDAFGEIVAAAQRSGKKAALGAIKKLAEGWVEAKRVK